MDGCFRAALCEVVVMSYGGWVTLVLGGAARTRELRRRTTRRLWTSSQIGACLLQCQGTLGTCACWGCLTLRQNLGNPPAALRRKNGTNKDLRRFVVESEGASQKIASVVASFRAALEEAFNTRSETSRRLDIDRILPPPYT